MDYQDNNELANNSDALPDEANGHPILNTETEEFADFPYSLNGNDPENMNWEANGDEHQVSSTTDDTPPIMAALDVNNQNVEYEQSQDDFNEAEQPLYISDIQQPFQIPNYEPPSFYVDPAIEQLPLGQLLNLLDQANAVVQQGQPLDVAAQTLYISTDAALHPELGVMNIMPAMGEYLQSWMGGRDLEYLSMLEQEAGILSTQAEEQEMTPELPTAVAEDKEESSNEELKPEPTRIVKCINCECCFRLTYFQVHVCKYGGDQKPIEPKAMNEDFMKSISDRHWPDNSAGQRLLAENLIRIRRFFKDTLKFDLEAHYRQDKSDQDATIDGKDKKSMGPYECAVCERKFVHASGLSRHMEKHTLGLIPQAPQANGPAQNVPKESALLECNQCGIIECSEDAMWNHLKTHCEETEIEDNPPVLDDQLEKYLDDAAQFLEEEAHRYQKNGLYDEFLGAPSLDGLVQMIITKTVLQCEYCDVLFASTFSLLNHVNTHSALRRFECRFCKIIINTSKEATNHFQAECVKMREHRKLNDARFEHLFVCTVCQVKFASLELLLDHRYTSGHLFPRWSPHYKELQLPCEYCPAFFATADEAVTHYDESHRKTVRTKERNDPSKKSRKYLCDVCGKSYTQSSHLWQHLRFHQGVKPFECTEPDCGAKFTIRPDLNDHIRKCHTFERPFKCMICSKTFLTGSVYYQHRLIHRGERRYECETCNKRFYRADALKNHLRIHTGERPFSCELCTKSFRQRGDRDKHMRARHAMLDEATREMLRARKRELEEKEAIEKKLLQKVLQVSGVLPYQPLETTPSNAPLIGPEMVQNILAMTQVDPASIQHPIDF